MNFTRSDRVTSSSAEEYSCEVLYENYGDMIFRVCFSILMNRCDEEDALQEVFYKYIVSSPIFLDQEHAKAWLIRVATNQCKDMLRRRKTRSEIRLDEIGELPAEVDFEGFGLGGESEVVLKGLLELPEKYKTVMLLHYLEDQSVQTISQTLAISESAVKMRLARGREKLRKQLEGDIG